jgi:hypothetical protein
MPVADADVHVQASLAMDHQNRPTLQTLKPKKHEMD